MELVFFKIVNDWKEEHIIICEQGKFKNPILILDKKDVRNLIKEWKRNVKKKTNND